MGKFRYLSSVLLVLNVTQFVLLSAQACGEKGWFGSNCRYQCNCEEEKCDFTTGECAADSHCEDGWFGPACQYVDLTTTESNKTTPAWLYDGDDGSCIRNEDSDKVQVKLAEPFPFTWLRLYFSDKGDKNSIQVQFKDDLSDTDDNLVDCNNKRTPSVDDNSNSFNVHCDQDSLVQQVILSGEGVSSLCSVHISGGRQVTLKQSTSQSSPAVSHSSFLAVDGETSTETEFCTRTNNGDTNPNWNVTFEQPKAINRVLLTYAQEKNEYITHVLTFYDKEDTQLLREQRYEESTSVSYYKTEIKAVEPVSVINVKVDAAPSSYKPLILCEVLAYGDTVCPLGKYGRECEHSCDNCLNQTCFVATGECKDGCVDGFVGGQCQTPCSDTYYGKDCMERCSTVCVDRLCDNVDGRCKQCDDGKTGDQCDEECPAGKYGSNCQKSCSPNCKDQLCHRVFGICDECPTGYSGDNCDTPCESGTYGQDCEQKCTPTCSSGECDPINGHCIYENVNERTEAPNKQTEAPDGTATDDDDAIVGAVVGSVIGVISAIVGVIVGVWYCRTKRNKNKRETEQNPEPKKLNKNEEPKQPSTNDYEFI